MYRFASIRKLHVNNADARSIRTEMQYTRTCTLCNRISSHSPFEGRFGAVRVHSTSVHPQPAFSIKNQKKYKVGSVPQSNVGSPTSKKRKMNVTILDSNEISLVLKNRSRMFFESSPSSAFARPMKFGVTIMLPPHSSKRMMDNGLKLPCTSSKESVAASTPKPLLSDAAAGLILNCLSRNGLLDYSYRRVVRNGKETTGPRMTPSHGCAAPRQMANFRRAMSAYQNNQIKCEASITSKKKKRAIIPDRKKLLVAPVSPMVVRTFLANKSRLIRRAAYIDVNLFCGKYSHAFIYARNGLKSFPDLPMRNIILEPLLAHAAMKRDIDAIVQVLALADSIDVRLSKHSHLICLEMLGRLPPSNENLQITKILVKGLKEQKSDLAEITQLCQNRQVMVQNVLRAINAFDPDCCLSKSRSLDCKSSSLPYPVEYKAGQYHSPSHAVISEELATKLVDEEIATETSTCIRIKNIACTLNDEEQEKLLEAQKKLENKWREAATLAFQRNLMAGKEDRSFNNIATFLEVLPVETYVDLIIDEALSRIDDSERMSLGFSAAQYNLGLEVKRCYDLSVLKKLNIFGQSREALIKYCKWYSNPEDFPRGPLNPREIWDSVLSSSNFNDASFLFLLRRWVPEMHTRVGKFLYEILLKDIQIDENIGQKDKKPVMVPALYAVYRKTTKGYQKQLKVHPLVHKFFPKMMQPHLTLPPGSLPMKCPPRPWASPNTGAFPVLSPALQRAPDSRIGEEALKEHITGVPTAQLYPVLDSLNQLGSIPWKINTPMLDIITEVFHSGGDKELSIPSPPSRAQLEPKLPESAPNALRSKISKERAAIRQGNADMYSLWCDTLYKLSIAHEFRDRVFWLPHSMDFRGRVYPVCPYLHHMSNDVARSLLIFAKGEKLGPRGLDWLKIHTINLIGTMSKCSLAERLAYANEVMPKILDSAERPLTGERWWSKSEYPWQTLSACMEITNALSSGDVENFVSHFPVHQDGSCNGLQHYAALGRDTRGATSVNLVNADKPADVYTSVAQTVEKYRAKDAAEGNTVAQSLEGYVTRKVIKQTVMTTVYGVTPFGAKMQILGQLTDLKFESSTTASAAHYLSTLVFQSLGDMFTSSQNIQNWLTECAGSIVKIKTMPVQWVTPLGLPVIQPYFKNVTNCTNVKGSVRNEIDPSLHRMPAGQKNRNAFSPNFIHSLDSSHMILTGLHCEQSNIPFVSVHDCFWVHAKNVDAMNKICREQFVVLHSKPILEDLSKFMIKTYCSLDESSTVEGVEERRLHRLLSGVPTKGDFNLEEVLKSTYFFS